MDVRYFQLGYVNIPSDVEERFLRALTLQEDALKEQLLQDAQIVRKDTDFKVCNLTLMHSEWPKLYGVLAILSAIGLM